MITIARKRDIEGDNNRGWQVDMIELIDGDENEIGYMKLAYIPKKRFESHYPHIVYYMDKIKGWCGLIRMYEVELWDELSEKLYLHDHSIGYNTYEHRTKKNSKEEWEFIGRNSLNELEKEYGDEFENFKEYFVDKYYVDYARIHDEYKGNKYYLKLYLEALEWANQQGFPLYSSTLKSDVARRAYGNYIKKRLIGGKIEYFKHSKSNRHRITEVLYVPKN